MTDVARVRTVSAVMFWIASLVLVAMPLTGAWLLLAFTPDRVTLLSEYRGITLPEMLSWQNSRVFVAVGLVPWVAAFAALWQMRRLFQHYRRGDMLSEGCALAIRRIGIAVLALLGLQVLTHPLQVLALTLGNPEGQRSVSVAFGSNDMALLLTGALILLIGWAMGEAVAAAGENRSFV
jgi:hypothetical protein